MAIRRADLPRVTYTSASGNLAPLHDMFDEELPRFRTGLGAKWPNRIGGTDDSDGKSYTAISPLDHDIKLGTYVDASQAAVAKAVAAARRAFEIWGRMKWRDRIVAMRRVARALDRARYDLAMATLYEAGKSRLEALGETEEVSALIDYYCDQMEKRGGFIEPPTNAPGETAQVLLRPIGVFAVIAPFNYPVALSVGMAGAALAAGNTVVFKPSPNSGLTAGLLVRAIEEADLPAGAINMICGEASGPLLVDAQGVDGFAFTGSHAVGMEILRKAARGPFMRPVLGEMGGKNPAYVSHSADVDVAVEGVAKSAFNFQGQKCSACSVAFVHERVYDAFMAALVKRAEALRFANTEQRDVSNGPLINKAALERYEDAIKHGATAGRLVTGGKRLTGGIHDRGYYVNAAIIEGLPESDRLFKDELFAPVLAVTKFTDLPAAIARGNSALYGLTAGFYGKDQDEIDFFLERVASGVLYVNRRSGATTGAWPGFQSFCGWKGSGLTGKGGLGPHYLPQFMREQSRTIRSA